MTMEIFAKVVLGEPIFPLSSQKIFDLLYNADVKEESVAEDIKKVSQVCKHRDTGKCKNSSRRKYAVYM